jgi:hypothetical protein
MPTPAHHLFVCGSFRANGAPAGACAKKQSLALVQHLQEEVDSRGLSGRRRVDDRLPQLLRQRPVVIDYPSGHWYKGVTEDAADAILDAIENGTVAEEFLLA